LRLDPDADVHVFVRVVHAAVGEQQFDRQAPEARLQRGQQWRQGMPAECGAAGDPQPPFGRGIQIGHGGLGALQVALDMAHLGQVQRTALGQGQGPGGAVEQAHAQVGLQPGDVLPDRRRADPQRPRGGGQAAGVGGPDEAAD
jgi:hypothetical protein